MSDNIPWYNKDKHWHDIAGKYLIALNEVIRKSDYREEIHSFIEFTMGKVIFESNLIEGAGLSEGETRKVINEVFPKIPHQFSLFKESIKGRGMSKLFNSKNFNNALKEVIKHGLSPDKIIPTISMEGKSRQYVEVMQHYIALLMALAHCKDFQILSLATVYYENLRNSNYSQRDAAQKTIPIIDERISNLRLKVSAINDPGELTIINSFIEVLEKSKNYVLLDIKANFLTEEIIKKIHKNLAEDLVPTDAGVPAGVYRIDNRSTGWDLVFPSPGLIPKCMEKFISDSNALLHTQSDIDIFDKSAEISYHFVRIHPFPDFNGRLSRIIMNMILIANGCPFPVPLRGKSKEKHRYIIALKHANKGNLKPLGTLIAMNFAVTCRLLDQNLRLAGIDPLLKN
jgi:fido (protein-threonine AMPylation protein)